MGLEADDGRPETSPPPRRGVQTADRAVVRERQAIPGDQGRARHRAIDPAAPGPGHPRQRLRPGRGQPHARAERAGRAGEAQQAVGDGGGRFRTSGAGIRTKAGVIRANAARYPISARCGILGVPRSTCLLDDRASRDGACGSDRRRRARGPARRPRTPRRQEVQGRPGKEGRHRVQETHRQHHARTGRDGRVRARTVRTAQDAGRRGQAREPAGPAGPTATPRTRIRRAILPMSASAETGRTCVRWSTWRTGASSAIPPGGPGTRAWYWARSPPSTSR
ncbi:ISSdy1 transposase OrfB [Bifidobacterium adolescentis]|uniref:ISSdy1 transposase OrfB n=1 Tax=Bifidobacterium adolescentis TaxID=1680 RepID=A0AB73NNR5_BIFAD|nr:ISSdy1 transposase OrfB [Bifidobacterium adolescentis]